MNILKLTGNMVYKNLLLRFLTSIFFILIYLIILSINFNYVFYLVLIIYIIVYFELIFYFNKYKIIPLLYISFSLLFFLLIDFSDKIHLSFNLFIIIIILFDTFSYIIGKFIGKNKFIKISPNKTVEGLLGGAICTFCGSLLIIHLVDSNITLKIVLFVLMMITTAFLGDLLESFFKRKNNLKNSSELIPGHGGVFDRFDSFLFSIIFYSITLNF